jgi:SAM-dependent methyltransferase
MTSLDPGWSRAHTEEDDQGWDDNVVQQIDFAIHNHYLHQYLHGDEHVLEAGAGAGRFTREVAGLSKHITVVDISPQKLQRNQRNARAMGYDDAVERWCECDICELSNYFDDGQFDAVVCYGGPLSYVFDRRAKAIRELARVVRSGGVLLLSARSLWGSLHENLPSILPLDPRINREIIASGNMGPDKVATAVSFWHAYRADEFARYIEGAGLTIELMSASNCLSATGHLLGPACEPRTWDHLV